MPLSFSATVYQNFTRKKGAKKEIRKKGRENGVK